MHTNTSARLATATAALRSFPWHSGLPLSCLLEGPDDQSVLLVQHVVAAQVIQPAGRQARVQAWVGGPRQVHMHTLVAAQPCSGAVDGTGQTCVADMWAGMRLT